MKGAENCVDYSTTLCPPDPETEDEYIWIACPSGLGVKCLKGSPNCEDNNPALCPKDPETEEPESCEEKETIMEQMNDDGSTQKTTTVLGTDPDDEKRCLKTITIENTPPVKECPTIPNPGTGTGNDDDDCDDCGGDNDVKIHIKFVVDVDENEDGLEGIKIGAVAM